MSQSPVSEVNGDAMPCDSNKLDIWSDYSTEFSLGGIGSKSENEAQPDFSMAYF